MLCKEHFDFQTLRDLQYGKRLGSEGEDGSTAACFFSHLTQFTSLYWDADSSSGE